MSVFPKSFTDAGGGGRGDELHTHTPGIVGDLHLFYTEFFYIKATLQLYNGVDYVVLCSCTTQMHLDEDQHYSWFKIANLSLTIQTLWFIANERCTAPHPSILVP